MLGVIHRKDWRAQGDAIRPSGMHELALENLAIHGSCLHLTLAPFDLVSVR